MNLVQLVGNLRVILFLISWLSAISSIVWKSDQNYFINLGVVSFSLFLIFTFVNLKRQSILIITFLLCIYALTVRKVPNLVELLEAGKFILIFAGLIPTMGLTRATANKLSNVKKAQVLLSALTKNSIASGFQISAHFFGSVINTGVFAILAAALPPTSNLNQRKLVAEAVLRGMSSSAIWSPFFVAFVVGQVYLDAFSSWLGLAIGLLIASVFSLLSILFLSKQLNLAKLVVSFCCLKPMIPTLLIIMTLVIGAALLFGLTALSAVIIVMPILVAFYFFASPKEINPICLETVGYLRKSSDDVLIISVAMLVGYFITDSPEALNSFQTLNLLAIPPSSALIFIPVTMAALSLIGIHPVISSTVLLSTFTSPGFEISPPLLMQAHLIGWCTGTMSSISSLSVITCSAVFKVPTSKLCFGINTSAAILFAFFGGTFLAIINELN